MHNASKKSSLSICISAAHFANVFLPQRLGEQPRFRRIGEPQGGSMAAGKHIRTCYFLIQSLQVFSDIFSLCQLVAISSKALPHVDGGASNSRHSPALPREHKERTKQYQGSKQAEPSSTSARVGGWRVDRDPSSSALSDCSQAFEASASVWTCQRGSHWRTVELCLVHLI